MVCRDQSPVCTTLESRHSIPAFKAAAVDVRCLRATDDELAQTDRLSGHSMPPIGKLSSPQGPPQWRLTRCHRHLTQSPKSPPSLSRLPSIFPRSIPKTGTVLSATTSSAIFLFPQSKAKAKSQFGSTSLQQKRSVRNYAVINLIEDVRGGMSGGGRVEESWSDVQGGVGCFAHSF